MMKSEIERAFDFSGQTILITGGSGLLGSEMARGLFACGANVIILGRNLQAAERLVENLNADARRNQALAVQADVLQKDMLQHALDTCLEKFGYINGLINAAGGNHVMATTSPKQHFFDLSEEGIRSVFDVNILGTLFPCQVIGAHMAERQQGVILNISSMNAYRPLTRIPAYSAAKAGVSNFTQWLAVHMAQEYSPHIRVNAIAPGFFISTQNRTMLIDEETGEYTERGQNVIKQTPMGRFGDPHELVGATLWLMSPAAAFVTGVIIPVDGGFSAYSGV
jgi:NAD(P)-dependent dehydrogenase (short-subunit alcohol dehydrogenase family)